MQELDDNALLREYVEHGSEEAFATLVARHVNKVYSVALRHTRNPHSAEEITQAVFVILARKSRNLSKSVVLSGWLYQTARLTAMTYVRGEIRRARREEEAHMQTLANETGSEVWPQIAPLLDAAMAALNETDRHAVVLRFFDGKSMKEVGAALGGREDAAKMRVNRAMEKLRTFFTKRGVAIPAAVLAATISANSVQAAPTALAKTATAIAMAKGATASGSTLTLIKASLNIMARTKLKFACGLGAAILLGGSVITVAVAHKAADKERYQIEGEFMVPAKNSGTSPTPVFETIRNFTLTVNGHNSAMRLTDPKLEANGIRYQEVVCLNGSIYRYDHFGIPAAGGPANSGGAVIKHGDFPLADGNFANFVWVGLASASYFAGTTNGMVPSLRNYPLDDAYRVKAAWQLSDAAPHLPKAIDFFANPEGRPPPFDHGWTDAEIRVLEETNVGGKTFPLIFTCTLFSPKSTGAVTSNDIEPAAIYRINVNTIRLDSVPNVHTPETPGKTYVGETRFPNNPGNNQIGYLSTADHLPEKPEAAAVKTYQQQTAIPATINSRRLKPGQVHHDKWVWISLILAVAAIVGAVGLKRMREA